MTINNNLARAKGKASGQFFIKIFKDQNKEPKVKKKKKFKPGDQKLLNMNNKGKEKGGEIREISQIQA